MSTESNVRTAMRALLEVEQAALSTLLSRLGDEDVRAVELLSNCTSKVIVAGLGKTGIIARKFSATLSSVGVPSCFMHASDAEHGDLGMVVAGDVLVALSNSGQTREIVHLASQARGRGVQVIAMTGDLESPLAKVSDVTLDVSVEQEGDPLGIVPMASTVVTLALADALVAGVMVARKVSKEHFAGHHPGGSLGKLLSLRVRDLMLSTAETPVVDTSANFKESLVEMTSKRLGATFIVDKEGVLCGILTDGDLRRVLETWNNPMEHPLIEIMTVNPKSIHADALAIEALRTMEEYAITVLPVVDDTGHVESAIHLHDLVKTGLPTVQEYPKS